MLGFGYFAVRIVETVNQLTLCVRVSKLFRSVTTDVETVTYLLFVFGCTQNWAYVVSVFASSIWTAWISGRHA